MDSIKQYQDEIQRRRLQEYIFVLEEMQEKAEDLAIEHERIKQTQDLLNAILDATTNGIGLIKDDRIVWCNKGVSDIFGWKHDELVGKSTEILFLCADAYSRMNKLIDVNTPKPEVITFESDCVHQNGRRISCLITHRPLDISDISKGYIISFTDFTERKRAEDALKEAYDELEDRVEKRTEELNRTNTQLQLELSERKRIEEVLRENEEKYRTVLEGNPDPVVVYDMEGKVIYFNPAFTRVFGWTLEERFGRKMDDFVPEEAWPETKTMIEMVRSGDSFFGVETLRYNKEGSIIHVSISGAVYRDREDNPVGSVINLRDIAEKKKLEAQLQHAQKMEAIGTLTGGIAHDFNNILAIIIGNTELALDNVSEWNSAHFNLKEIHTAGQRAKDVVRRLLSFARKTDYDQKPIRLDQVIQDSIKLLRATIPTTIDIRRNFQATADIVIADPTQVHQIMINLCTNAFHAMEDAGGILEIGTENVILDEDSAVFDADLTYGNYVKVTVSDTGQGIPSEIRDRIFDPYFTTKEVGKGTGMGLSVVHGIVKSNGGGISVESETGKRTTFSIYFPVVEKEAVVEKETVVETETVDELPSGSERILLVDDEESMVYLGRHRLESLRYQVETRTNPIEALELFRANPNRFDLVIADMTMPRMTGDQLMKEILKIRPEIPTIICTGFSEKIDEEKAKEIGIRKYIEKPINKQDLANLVRKVLDEK